MPIIPAEKRIDGMYGEVYVLEDGQAVWWADVTNVTGTVTVERKPINPAGSVQTYNKRGRVSREGTLTFDKVDSRLEKKFLESVNKDLATRRANRNVAWFERFTMHVKLDDPDSWGSELLVLQNCEFWTLPIGFSLSEMRTTELQFTWEREDLPGARSSAAWITRPTGT